MESETETEQNGSFSLWTNGINPPEGNPIVQVEQTPESTSTQVSEAHLSGYKLEDLVEALTRALHIKKESATSQEQFLIEGETITQTTNENERIYQETEDFYRQIDEPSVHDQEQITAQKEVQTGDSPFYHPENHGLSKRQNARFRQKKKANSEFPLLPVFGGLNNCSNADKLAYLEKQRIPNRDFYEAIASTDPNLNHDDEASQAHAIFKATGQLKGLMDPTSDRALRPMQTIMIEGPDKPRTDPTYVVDFTQSHCNKYELKLMKNLVDEYKDTFATYKYDLGLAKVDPVDIKTTDEIPVTSKFLQIPYKMREEVRQHEKEMLKSGVIEESDTPWVSSWVAVPKKDGTQRPCTDFRPLNTKTITDPFPLPRIDGILESFANCHW